jgi:hypothetical protein
MNSVTWLNCLITLNHITANCTLTHIIHTCLFVLCNDDDDDDDKIGITPSVICFTYRDNNDNIKGNL